MSFENWLAWFSRHDLQKAGLRADGNPLQVEEPSNRSVDLRADLSKIHLNYNQKAQLGLADASPKGLMIKTFR
jgi:hypothetical protein